MKLIAASLSGKHWILTYVDSESGTEVDFAYLPWLEDKLFDRNTKEPFHYPVAAGQQLTLYTK